VVDNMKYIDFDGSKCKIENGQDKLLRRLYKSVPGRMLLKPLVSPFVSKIAGTFLNTAASKFLIQPFINANRIDMSSYVRRKYSSYNDFFTREIRPEERMIDYDPQHLISPSDGKVSAYALGENSSFQVKHSEYTLQSILKNRNLAQKYKDGVAVIIRLTVDDYHRYCYAADGVKSQNHRIPGVLHTVNPVACETLQVYKENSREYTVISTQHFGDIVQMEVGAMMVGRICNYHQKGTVRKGQEKGKFEFGGSTIILFLEKERVEIAGKFLENTKRGYETRVRMGQCIGYAVD